MVTDNDLRRQREPSTKLSTKLSTIPPPAITVIIMIIIIITIITITIITINLRISKEHHAQREDTTWSEGGHYKARGRNDKVRGRTLQG